MTIRLAASRLFRTELQTRMPFKYGIATMTLVPHFFLVLTVEVDGVAQDGIAADHLPPKWFTKNPARSLADEIDEMLRVIHHAIAAAREMPTARSVFTFWHELRQRQAAWAATEEFPPLLAHFGPSLVEWAVIDACARSRGAVSSAIAGNAFELDLGAIHPELAGSTPADWLLASPLPRVIARHTVGLSDPLTEADVAPTSAASRQRLTRATRERATKTARA